MGGLFFLETTRIDHKNQFEKSVAEAVTKQHLFHFLMEKNSPKHNFQSMRRLRKPTLASKKGFEKLIRKSLNKDCVV